LKETAGIWRNTERNTITTLTATEINEMNKVVKAIKERDLKSCNITVEFSLNAPVVVKRICLS